MNENISLTVGKRENIRRILRVLRAICRSVIHDEEVGQADFTAVIDFIRNCADHHHRKKEEERPFKVMVANMGKIGENLVTHDTLAERGLDGGHVFALTEVLERFRQDPSDDNRLDIIVEAVGYVALLDRHTKKENTVIYPSTGRNLPPEIFVETNAASAALEANSAEQALCNKYKAVADRLETKYDTAA